MLGREPSERYVMVDDKRRILASLKSAYPDRFTTVHVLQRHYAHADADLKPDPTSNSPPSATCAASARRILGRDRLV